MWELVKRKLIQFLAALGANANLAGFSKGKIWQGASKEVCVPVLNCYSCPGALGACPLGSLQNTFAGTSLRFPAYVLGFLLLFGILLGRVICGWLCPFGLIQELFYKLPGPKLVKNNFTRQLCRLKYLLGLIFLFALPALFWLVDGVGSPAFCKFICPAGTLEAGVPLTLVNKGLRSGLGALFAWKFFLLVVTVGAAVLIYRPFCRFVCPLGAWYGLFNRWSFLGMQVDQGKCTGCQACVRTCKMDVRQVGDAECIACGECRKVCPEKAITLGRRSEAGRGQLPAGTVKI